MKIFIIGGGYSLTNFNRDILYDYGTVIGVNDAAVRAKCHIGCSMDRLWAEHRLEKLIQLKIPVWLRNSATININNKIPSFWKIYSNDNKSCILSEDEKILNGSNSGMCALNLAYLLKPSEIYLFGFDMSRTGNNSYWYPNYEWVPNKIISNGKYKKWGTEFDTAIKQCRSKNIKLFNVNPTQTIRNMNTINFKQFMKEYIR